MNYPAYAEYKPSGIDWLGDVPEHWEILKLKFFATLETNKADDNGGIKIGLENIEGFTGRYLETGTEFEGNGIAFQPGDILYGKLRPYLAKVLLVNFSGSAVGDFFVLQPQANIIPKFLLYRLLEDNFINLSDGSTFGAKMPRVDWKFMADLKFSLPPMDEQRTIADFLDGQTARFDALIEKTEKQIERLQEKRTALISHAVTKGLDPNAELKPSGIDWLDDVPEHWEVKRLKYSVLPKAGAIKTGPFGSQLKNQDMLAGEVKVYNQRNVIDNDFDIGEYFISNEKHEQLTAFNIGSSG